MLLNRAKDFWSPKPKTWGKDCSIDSGMDEDAHVKLWCHPAGHSFHSHRNVQNIWINYWLWMFFFFVEMFKKSIQWIYNIYDIYTHTYIEYHFKHVYVQFIMTFRSWCWKPNKHPTRFNLEVMLYRTTWSGGYWCGFGRTFSTFWSHLVCRDVDG